MQIGSYQVDFVEDGSFALDGGAMFGVVPWPLWRKLNPPDERNRIDMALRCLLLRGHGRTIMVDGGIGRKLPPKEADIYKVDHSRTNLLNSLQALKVRPEDVTDVIITHLHFDHCGGLVHTDGTPTFPNAHHYVQRKHYEWATHPTVKDRASFRKENFEPLQLTLLDGPEPVFPEIQLIPLNGHTQAMQAVLVEPDLFYPTDLVPTASHVRLPFSMGYDNFPLTTIEEKQKWLPRAAREGWWVVFEHDPATPCARLEMTPDGDFKVAHPACC